MSGYQNLLRSLDSIIESHGANDPKLRKELETLREQIVEANSRKSVGEIARLGLQIFTLAKWLFDHLPPPH